jgi:predicted HicB family RNase H-like nuclease
MYKGQTDARRKANQKYLKESVEDIRIRVPRGQKEVYKAHADSQRESLNSFVIRAMNETIERDQATSDSAETKEVP